MLDTPLPGRVQLVTTRSLPYTRAGTPPTGDTTAAVNPAGSSCAPAGLPGVDSITGRAGSENFPVASRLLPRDIRHELMDIYRWARFVDEIGNGYAFAVICCTKLAPWHGIRRWTFHANA